MHTKFSFLLIILIFFNFQSHFAQVTPVAKDSLKMFRNIEKYSKKRKFTKFIHKLIFRPITKQKVKKSNFQKIKKANYLAFEGKIIRNIHIITLDPFGLSETDSTKKPKSLAHKFSNRLHVKTKRLAIANLLLIKKNKPLDSLLFKESERLIRSQRFVRGVNSNSELVGRDSVDIYIRVLDSWSLVPKFSTSTSRSSFYITERNFLGIGHEFSNAYFKSLNSSDFGYRSSYTIPNILNTFVRTTMYYNIDLNQNYSKFLNIERPFFSPYSRWAAGLFIDQQSNKLVINDSINKTQNIKYNTQDYWIGRSFKLFKGNSEFARTTNFILNARFLNRKYTEKDLSVVDSLGIYTRENLYLVGLGLSSRKFTQDKYLFNFNVIEDVASGFLYSLTTGYRRKYDQFRFYAGGRVAIGDYFSIGYLSGDLEYGTFLLNGKTNQSALNFKIIYFTNLLETGKWKFRQFVKPQIVLGSNRMNTNFDRLNLNNDTGIQGFNSETIFGTKKLLLTLQTQGYSPWRILGFRLNPFLSCSMGMLAQESNTFKDSKLYSQFGVGVIISNDYLVFNTFQFSFSFYPVIPGQGNSLFKTNTVRTSEFGLQNFEVSKPTLVNYQ